MISVDFPDPETPVTHVIKPIGISTLKFFKLLDEAPKIDIFLLLGRTLFLGILISFLPEIYIPVIEFSLFSILSGVPSAIISPPYDPAPGPISIT